MLETLPRSNAISDLVGTTGNTGEGLLRASLQLFSSKGFNATSVRDIAQTLGTSVAAIYYHAASKEAILTQLMRLDLEWLISRAISMLDTAKDPAEQIVALVTTHIVRDEEGLRLLVLSDSELRSIPPDTSEEIVALRSRYEMMWRDSIRAGITQGYFLIDDPKLAAFALLDMCNGVARWYSPKGELTLEEVAARFAKFALELLSVQEAPQVGSSATSNRNQRLPSQPKNAIS